MRLTKFLSVLVLALALPAVLGSAGIVPIYGTGDIYSFDTQLAKGVWAFQMTPEPNKPNYFQAELAVDTNRDNKFTDEDAKYKITGTPLNAVSGMSFRCTPIPFIQYSVHVNASFDVALNGQTVATARNGVIDFRSDDQRSWIMILNANLDSKDGLEAIHGSSVQFTPISIVNPCP
jgi:hypothetical protein